MINYNGHLYYDDRMFIFYLCKGKVSLNSDGSVATTIYHVNAPTEHVWCLTTYHNYDRYPIFRIDCFYKKDDAITYMKEIEPQLPLISLFGKPMAQILSYENFEEWKKKNNCVEYDWRKLYPSRGKGSNPSETIYQTMDSFLGIR